MKHAKNTKAAYEHSFFLYINYFNKKPCAYNYPAFYCFMTFFLYQQKSCSTGNFIFITYQLITHCDV